MAAALCIPGDCCTTTVTTIPGPIGPSGAGVGGISGVINVGTGVESGTVAGLGLASAPKVSLTVQSPSGGLVMYAVVVGSPTTDGFAWQLSGLTDGVNYKLHYQLSL